MKKMWKRFVSLLLACTLLAGMLPLSASAQATAPTETEWIRNIIGDLEEDKYELQAKTQLSGSDVWMYIYVKSYWDSELEQSVNDTVFIFQPGQDAASTEIPNYDSASEGKPWSTGKPSAIYIADGVTGIGNHAFDGMTTLETLEIEDPTSLKSVGDYAFNGCDKLVGPLDLSGVTDMGKYAFNGCERLGSGENNKGVTLSDELTTIPENAFNTCGLKNVNIPTSCTEIGNNAFANNSLSGELNLPSSLNTIGERAFYRYNSSSDTGGFSSITIPSSVTKIGANAFSGHKSLETVTLEHEDKKNLTIEDGAFGTDTYTAHNYLDSIKVGDITYENVSMGTQFLTKNNVGELLNNGVNCYLGDLKPLEYEKTVLPTCEKEGYHLYKMTLEGASTENEPVKVETQISISAPGHAYEQCPDLPATCTQPQRTHRHCTNLEKGVVRSCELVDEIRQKVDGKGMLGHNYQVTKIENPIIGAGVGDTVITYTCQNWNSDPDQNLHDGENISHTYSWKIEDKPIAASTAHTLEELTLPSVQGVDNTYYASLEWAVDKETLETPLEDGTHPYNVKLVVPGAGLTFPECTGIGDQLLQVTVQVDKIKLDFSQVEFQNNIRYVAQNNGAFGVLNLPEDADITKTEYRKDNGEWTEDAPEENAVNVGEYQVRVTFTYTSSKYLLDTDSHDLQPPAGYTLAAGDELGTGTLTGPYEIKQMTADDLRVSPIGNLTYDGEEHETVQIDGVPVGADVTVQWNDQEGNPQTETYKAEATSMSVAGITNAGTYDVTITVEHGTFEDGSATKYARGVIAKREISTPTANTLGSYTPEKVQIGVNDPTGEYVGIYTVDYNKQINAGTYEATATLLAPNNYKWSTSEGAAVNISYTIPRRVVQKPGVTSSTYTFTGQPIEVLYRTNQSVLDGEYDENGNLTAFWRDYGKEYVVYTATNVQKTDVGTYKVTVALNNKDANNYWWAGQDATDYSFTWKINKQSINAPTVEAADATYTGLAYDAKNKIKISTHTETSEDVLVLGSNHKYYTSQSGGNAIGTPVNAGTYWVAIDFDFAEGEKESNYNIVGNNRTSFTINKAPLTLTAPTDGLTATYTGQAITVPAPEIGSYPEHGEQNATLTYTYKLKDSDDAANTAEGELKLTDVGTYTITVQVSDSCRNYTSESKTYEFKITAADQTVRLTQDGSPVENGATISKTLGDDSFTVTGKGYVGENETNAKIAYAVTQSDASDESKDAVVKVDANSGQVTLLRAGSATITVTAAGSANYQAATATYTITVDKGTPKIQAGDKEIPYDGAPLEEKDYQATVSGVKGAVVPSGELSYQFYNTEAGATEGGEDSKIEAPSAVGDYWLRVSYPGDANYLPAHKVVKVTITNAALFVTPHPYNKEYDGIGHAPATFTVTGVGGATLETDDYKVSFAKKEGQYADTAPHAKAEGVWDTALTVQDVADSGQFWYKIEADSYDPYVGEDPITVTVNPKPLQIKKEVTAHKSYDGTKTATVNIEKLKTGVTGEEIKVTDTHAEYNSAEVGASFITITYTLEAVGTTDLDNYIVSAGGEPIVGGSAEETVTTVDGTPVGITPAPITVAINDQKKVYDGQSLSIENPVQDTHWSTTGTIYLQDGVKDDLGIALSIASGSKDAGTYAITGKWTNKNYEVTFTGSWTGGTAGTYTITPRPIKVEIGDAEGFYGDAPVKPSGLLKDISTEDGEGLVEGDSLDQFLYHVVINASPNTDVGSHYTITGTSGEYGNYNVTFASGTYTVNPRPITITIKDHSSKYGAEIDGGIADPDSGEDYTVAITGNATTGDAIVNGDDLGIALFTTAKKGDNAGTYSISGKVSDGDVSENYSITWAGETPWSGSGQDSTAADSAKGTYTIDKAQLKVSVKRSDIYAQYGEEISNPVTFTNESTGQKIASDASDYTALSQAITYEMNPSDGLTQVEGSENAEGKFTVAVTQQMVTVTVNVAATENYEAATEITYHIHASASGSLDVSLPFADLTYNGQPQQLLAQAPELPDGVYIRYKVGEKGAWTEYSDADSSNWQTLVGTGAGDYTVYWETKAGGNYNASSGHETTEIKKADLSATYTGLNDSEVILVLSEMGDTYTIPLDLTGNEGYTHSNGDGVTFLSGNTDVAIAKNSTATLELRGVAGEAKITINCPGDNNYNPGTFTFTVKITDQKAEIKYNITGATTTYNGQPQTIAVNVTAPASGATVMYQDEDGNYTLSEPPAYTDVKEGGYPIKFQITAPGYKTEEGTATLKIEPKPITENMIAGIAESYTYVGHQIRPETVAVVDDSVILTKDTDYTLEYGANEEVGEDKGSVIIKGTGNYTGEVTVYFNIAPVDGSSGMTASIDPAYGTYDPDGNTATVTVTHQTGTDSHEVTLTAENASYTITATDLVTGDPITERGATGTGNTLTFTKPAIYDITLTLTGDHRGEFHLSYTLLPLSNEDGGLTLTVDDETQKVFTYGDEIDSSGAAITVTADGNIVTDQCTLTYEYTGFDQTTVSGDYSPSVLKNAGVYTVTATPTEGSTITGTGTFTFLILQRDLADAILDVDDADLVFNHDEKRPSVTVTVDGNAQPTKDADYTITYYNSVNASNAAKAVVTATGNNFTGSKTEDFTIAPKPITECVVKDIPDQYYTGNEVIPPVTITDGNYTLILGYDYTTACDAIGPGTATVTIEGKGNYTGTTTKDFVIKSEGAPEPSERFDLAVRPSQWTWGDDLTNLDLSVTFGTGNELALGTDYTLTVDGETASGEEVSETFDGTGAETPLNFIKSLKPGTYTITATGTNAYKDSKDTETVTVKKIQPELTVTAAPETLSGGGKVTLTLKGEKLPAFAEGQDLSSLLTASAKDEKNAPDLSELEWETDEQTGVMTAELTLPNTSETYTFTLTFTGNEYYEAATASEQVVVAQQIISGGGGGPVEDQPADPDDTGVSDWLNTKDHLAYLAGYPGGTFGPDQNMTRAEAAQMFYNLLLEKDVKITVEFEDVPADAWYAKPVNTLASLGILSGVGNGRFDPERSITRAEFTVIAMKFANTSGGGVNIFSDVNEDDWFYSAVVDSTQYGWINGYPDGTFRPEATISRAEVTVIVNHMLGRAADRPYVIAHEKELNTFGDVNRGHWGYFHVAEATNAHEYHTEDGTESWTGLS